MPTSHAFEFLTGPSRVDDPPPPGAMSDIAAVVGNDAALRRWSIDQLVGDSDWSQFDGDTVRWTDLRDDLSTASLFDVAGDAKRSIVVRSADKFVSAHRPQIEDYASNPGGATRLILELDSLPSNTIVFKKLNAAHLIVGCGNANDAKQGVNAASRKKFLTSFVAARHQVKLSASAAAALIEILGEDIGMLDTEIAKLALYAPLGGKIDEAQVREIVSGWKGKTVWEITDAIASGKAAEALRQLDKLFTGGGAAIALLPQIAYSLRRLGLAVTIIEHRERTGRAWKFEDALSSAGVRQSFQLQSAKQQLQSIGRARALKMLPWLLDADLRLKGTHSREGRDRFLLEHFVIRLANQPRVPGQPARQTQ